VRKPRLANWLAPEVRSVPRIGCVKYLNARPLIHGWPGKVQWDHPAMLCRRLAQGRLDAALVSSFEYLRNPIYSIVDEVAVASDGPVYSVVLAHGGPLENLRQAVIDPASATSVNLLRCLLGERGLTTEFVNKGDVNSIRGRLFIGDQAIRFREENGSRFQFFDLGAAWRDLTGLPFVYALWLLRPNCPDRSKLADGLRSLGKANRKKLDAVIAAQAGSKRLFCDFYFRQCLRFSFGDAEKQGFRYFAERCVHHRVLANLPPSLDLL
jgi:predicted solute-binding protein